MAELDFSHRNYQDVFERGETSSCSSSPDIRGHTSVPHSRFATVTEINTRGSDTPLALRRLRDLADLKRLWMSVK